MGVMTMMEFDDKFKFNPETIEINILESWIEWRKNQPKAIYTGYLINAYESILARRKNEKMQKES